jgi:RNA polymerase sigma-70 factor (ECF subfamily)
MNGAPSGHTQTLRLIRQLNAGDENALDNLFERYQIRISSHVRLKLKRRLRGRMDTMDIVQDVNKKVLQKLRANRKFKPRAPGSFYRWLKTIAENVLRDAVKRHTVASMREVQKELSIESGSSDTPGPGLAERIAAPTDDPGKKLDLRVHLERVEELLNALPPENREALTLRFIEGLPPSEIAVRRGISADAVRMLLARTLVKVRAWHKQKYGGIPDDV